MPDQKITLIYRIFLSLFFTSGFYPFCQAQYHWVRHPNNPVIIPDQSQGVFAHNDPALDYDGKTYHLWLTGGGFIPNDTIPGVRIYYFTSPDARVWSYAETNPVFYESAAGHWDSGHIETPSVIKVGEEYWMYFVATPDSLREEGSQLQVGLAQSPDGIHWIRHPANPLLQRGETGAWDERWIESPCVVKTDSLFYLWFNGFSLDWKIHVGLATSRDGITWEKYKNNPVFSPATDRVWDSAGVYAPQVRQVGEIFVMFYTGIQFNTTGYDYANTCTGIAISPDGMNWTRATEEPVLSGVAEAWDATGPFTLDWVVAEDTLVMLYISDLKVGLATSVNELTMITDKTRFEPVPLQLYQNFPNPFNTATVIQYFLTERSDVDIEILNVLGRSVKKIFLPNQPPGLRIFHLNFNGINATLAGGVYFCQMKTAGCIQTRKMVYLR